MTLKKMLDVLEVYERDYNSQFPVVCLDEKSKQLTKDIRTPIPCKPSVSERCDYEYKRNGTANLFIAIEPKGKKRVVRVTKRRTKRDYASFIKYLVTKTYKDAKKVVLVEDNLNTHTDKALIEILGKEEGKQCLKRNIPTFQTMQSEVASCARKRNKDKVGINWQFTREKAKKKFKII